MSTDYETRDEINAKTQLSTNSARVRNNNPRRRLVGLLLLLLPPPEPAPITRRRSSFFFLVLLFLSAAPLSFSSRPALYIQRAWFSSPSSISSSSSNSPNTRDVMSSTCVRPKEREIKKNQKGGWGGGPLECACARLFHVRKWTKFFFSHRKRTFSYPYPPVPCCPHPLSKVPMFPVPTQFLPRVGCFVSNEICNRKPATLGHAPRRKSTGTSS